VHPYVLNAVVGGVLAGAFLLFWQPRRWWWLVGIPVVAAIGCAIGLGWMPARPLDGAPTLEAGTLLAWLALGFAGRAAGPMLPRSAGVAAVLGGALLGDLAAIALLSPRAPDGKTAVRMALVASAGALLSPIGTPVTLLLASPTELAPLAVLLALVAWPGGARVDGTGSVPASVVLLSTALLAAAWPDHVLWTLLGGAALCALMGRSHLRTVKLPLGGLAWVIGAAVVAWSARHSGAFAEVLISVEWAQGAAWLEPAAFGIGALAGMGSEPAGALLAASLVDTTAGGPPPQTLALAVGVAIGGLSPIALTGGPWRAAVVPYLLQLLVALVWLMV